MWVLFALSSALSLAAVDALSKRSLQRADEFVVAWIRFLFAAPFLLGLLFFVAIPPLGVEFWLTLLALIPLEILAVILYVRAIKIAPLSLTIPFLSFSPVFLVLTGYVILGESVEWAGAGGIALIVLGAYIIQGHTATGGMMEPFRALIREPGSRLMIAVAFIYSITSALGKRAILHSDPVTFGVVYFSALALAFGPIALLKSRGQLSQIRTHWKAFLNIGFLEACMIIFHALALARTAAAYMIAVKRSSILFSVAFGYLFFGEIQIRQRMAGSLLMLAGVAVISLRG